MNYGNRQNGEFRKDAVRIALTSGLARKQIADELDVSMSTLNKWITAHRDTDVVSGEDRELALENEQLWRENRILKDERGILKKATVGSTGQRNGSFKNISRRLKAQRFSWSCIEPEGDLIEVTPGLNG